MVDVIVVGARCAGAAVAMLLARRGWQVLMLDKDPPNVGNLTSSASTAAFPQSSRYFDQLGRLYKLSLELSF